MNKKMTLSGRALHEKRIDTARANILAMMLLTAVNIIILFTEMDIMFPFSATVPYYFAAFAYILELPELYAVTVVSLLIYLVCWIFSKKRFWWLIIAAICYVLDCVYLVYIGIDLPEASIIIDLLFHIWVLYYVVMGILSGFKLRKVTEEDAVENTADSDSAYIGVAEDVKHRVLAEADYETYKIIYRRVKSTNELVINGYVYDSVKLIIESPHTLNATIDGINFAAGYDGAYSSISVNGKVIAKKRRLW